MDPIKIHKGYPEEIIQNAIIKELRNLEWFVKVTHGNMYQFGFPDLFCAHRLYGHRWVEVKNPKAFSFTKAQREFFPQFCANGSGIWVAVTPVGIQDLLMRPCNWTHYLSESIAFNLEDHF